MCSRQLDASPHQPDALIIIDGPRGNGKTLIAQELAKALYVQVSSCTIKMPVSQSMR